jgi:Na+-transporting NADH:ubiquinone oxidoreductase subunit B
MVNWLIRSNRLNTTIDFDFKNVIRKKNMKPLRHLMEKMAPNFEKGGKLEKWWPVYDGFATFLFVPGHTTHKGVHVRDSIDLKRTMIMVVLAMVPALLFGIYNVGYQHFQSLGMLAESSLMDLVLYGSAKVLPMVVVSYGVGLGVEFLFCIIKRHSINEGYLVSGMLIPLICPPDLPLWMLAVACIFAVVIGKEVFGGTGMNVLNIALTARAFLFFAYPQELSGDQVWISGTSRQALSASGNAVVDGYTGETALAQFVSKGDAVVQLGGNAIQNNQDLFMQGFLGFIPGSVGETSTLAILIGALLLIATGIGSWRIMLSVVLGGLAVGALLNGIASSFPDNPYLALPPQYHLVFGGFAFGAVFMATDPVSAAQTNTGKYLYGFLIGVLAVVIRVLNPAYPEGMMLAILFMNIMAPLIDHYVIQGNIKRRLNRAKTLSHA